jgi:FAD/FMN-containing dehydrogenase
MPRSGAAWTDAEGASLRVACADAAWRWSDIGRALGRTGTACQQEAIKRGWLPRSQFWAAAPSAKPASSAATVVKRSLTPEHAAELRRRGISQETINMMGRK